MRELIKIEHNILHSQSKGCWLTVHVRYTMIYFRGWWKRWQGIRVEINAPQRTQHAKYHGELGRYRISWL